MKKLPVAFSIFWSAVLTIAVLCAWDFLSGKQDNRNADYNERRIAQPLAMDSGVLSREGALTGEKIGTKRNAPAALRIKAK